MYAIRSYYGSLREPFTEREFASLVGEHYKGKPFADAPITVPCVNPERTFLEKLFLLHEEFQKPDDEIRVDRLSRHLYDVEMLMRTEYAEIALANKELYNDIIEHRSIYTKISNRITSYNVCYTKLLRLGSSMTRPPFIASTDRMFLALSHSDGGISGRKHAMSRAPGPE